MKSGSSEWWRVARPLHSLHSEANAGELQARSLIHQTATEVTEYVVLDNICPSPSELDHLLKGGRHERRQVRITLDHKVREPNTFACGSHREKVAVFERVSVFVQHGSRCKAARMRRVVTNCSLRRAGEEEPRVGRSTHIHSRARTPCARGAASHCDCVDEMPPQRGINSARRREAPQARPAAMKRRKTERNGTETIKNREKATGWLWLLLLLALLCGRLTVQTQLGTEGEPQSVRQTYFVSSFIGTFLA